MKTRKHFFVCFFVLLIACSSPKQDELSSIEEPEKSVSAPTLKDLGVKIFPIDNEADFSRLSDLQLRVLENQKEYLSFYNFGSPIIYLYDYESGELRNKLKLASEGPNTVPVVFTFQHFFHTSDSVFINTQHSGYYLIDGNSRVLNKIGTSGTRFNFAGNKITFDAATYFSGDKIYASYKVSAQNKVEDLAYTRATLNLNNELEISPIHSSMIVHDFEKNIDIRRQEIRNGKKLFTMRRQFARSGDLLFATTPISDSIKVFRKNELVNTIHATVGNFQLPSYREYINLSQLKNIPGEVSSISKRNQPPQYVNMLVDPKGQYLYRVLVTGTKAKVHPDSGVEFTSPTGAILLAIDLNTRKVSQKELPIDEIELSVPYSAQLFASSRGVHFRAKNQNNEDEVQFRVFGFSQE